MARPATPACIARLIPRISGFTVSFAKGVRVKRATLPKAPAAIAPLTIFLSSALEASLSATKRPAAACAAAMPKNFQAVSCEGEEEGSGEDASDGLTTRFSS